MQKSRLFLTISISFIKMGTFPQVLPFKFSKIGIFNLLDFYIYKADKLKGGTWGNVPLYGAFKSKKGFGLSPNSIRDGVKSRQEDQCKER